MSSHVSCHRGALRNVINAERDAMDADALLTNSARRGRRSRVVLTPRRWRQVCAKERRRRWQKSPVTGESTKETVKTIAQGRPGVPVTCGDYTRVLPTHCTRGCGCIGHPAFPAPSVFSRVVRTTTRAFRAARMRTHVLNTSQLSSPATGSALRAAR